MTWPARQSCAGTAAVAWAGLMAWPPARLEPMTWPSAQDELPRPTWSIRPPLSLPLVFLCDGTAGQMGDVAMRYGNDLHALLRLPVRQDHRIGTKLVANLLHCLTCRRGDEFSDAHALPPTIAVTRIVLKSGT